MTWNVDTRICHPPATRTTLYDCRHSRMTLPSALLNSQSIVHPRGEFVEVIGERHIDKRNISDFLMRAYDGFLDIVEIKPPEGMRLR